MYTAIPFGSITTGADHARPLDIRVRQDEIVRPILVRYVWRAFTAGSVSVTFAISRMKLHRSQPPTSVEMLEGGSVFFGLAIWRAVQATLVGVIEAPCQLVVDLRGVQVAGDLTVCCSNGLGLATNVRAEFYYEVVKVGQLEKAIAIWRGESAEQPN